MKASEFKKEIEQMKKEKAPQETVTPSDAYSPHAPNYNYTTRLEELQIWANVYKKAGFNPLPCDENAKKPSIAWNQYQYQELPIELCLNELKETSNLGVTQHVVKYAIIDFDNVDNMYKKLEGKIDLDKRTLIANTSKGLHVLVKVLNYKKLNSDRNDDLKVITITADGKSIGEIRLKGNTIVPPSKINNIQRNWYYVSINEMREILKQNSLDKLRPITPDEFLSYIVLDDLLEIDLLNFADYVLKKQSVIEFTKEDLINDVIEDITDLDTLTQEIINLLKKHYFEGVRHDLTKGFTSFFKYRYKALGLSEKEAFDLVCKIIKTLSGETNDNEINDRLRAIWDTFDRNITEHNRTLTNILGEDYSKLKSLIRKYRIKKSTLKSYKELDAVVKQVAQDLRAVTYDDSKYILWFSNGDAVEFSEKPLYTYITQTYKFFPDIETKKQEAMIRWQLYKSLEPYVSDKRVKQLKWYHEGIHEINSEEFLIVLSDDHVYVYNTAFDDFYKASKVQGNAIIDVRNTLKDFDVSLLETLLSIDQTKLLNITKSVWNELKSYLQHWNFEDAETYRALASLLIIIPLHTAWKWRPVLHFYGAAGCGKTTLFDFLRTVYPSLCVQRSDTSKAGLLQTFSNTSYIALFDNFETSQFKKSDFFTVLEGASTGFEENKGTKDGKGISYTYRNLTILNSVKDFVQKEALDTRTIQFVLHRPTGVRPDALSTSIAKEYATVSLAFSLRYWTKINEIYDELSRKGRAYQNIAYMYAIDNILNEASIDDYSVFIQQRRTKSEEIQLFRDILYSRIRIDGFDYVVIDILISYVQSKNTVKDTQVTTNFSVGLTDLNHTRSKLSEAGISLIEAKTSDFEIAFDYQRLVQWKILDKEEISENTFKSMLDRVKKAGIPFKNKSVNFGSEPTTRDAFNFVKFLEFLGIHFEG